MERPYPVFNPKSVNELFRGWLIHVHKCRDRHDLAARRCDTLRYVVGVPTITLTAIVGTSVFSTLGHEPDLPVKLLVGLSSVAAAVLAALQTFLDYPARAERHRAAAAKYKGLIHEIEQVLCDDFSPSLREPKTVDRLRDRLADLEESSPVVPQRIYDHMEQRYQSFEFVPQAEKLITPLAVDQVQ